MPLHPFCASKDRPDAPATPLGWHRRAGTSGSPRSKPTGVVTSGQAMTPPESFLPRATNVAAHGICCANGHWRKIVAKKSVGNGMRGRGLELPEGRRAAWPAVESRDRRRSAQPRPGIVETAGDKGANYLILYITAPIRAAPAARFIGGLAPPPRTCWKSSRLSCKRVPAGKRSRSSRVLNCRHPCRTRRRCPAGVAQRPEPENVICQRLINRPP